MTATLYAAAAAALLAAQADPDRPRGPHPFAPSLPELTDEEERRLDEVIDRFIRFDTGRLPGEAGRQAKAVFDRLGPEAIPALIRGLNRAAKLDHSCPVATIAKKLARMLASSTDAELLDFARENIGAGVRGSPHLGILRDLRVACNLRRNALARAGVRPTPYSAPPAPPAAKTLAGLSVSELAELAGKERGPKLEQALTELEKRSGDEALAALAAAATSYDAKAQQFARGLLAGHLARQAAEVVRERLKDGREEVRAAAAQAAGAKRLMLGAELIDLLTDEDARVRRSARQALIQLNRGADLGPRGDSAADREQAAKQWKAWWDRTGGR
jgi:hypothetical protein